MIDINSLDRKTIQTLLDNGIVNLEDLKRLTEHKKLDGDGIPITDSLQGFYEHLMKSSSIHTARGYKQNVTKYIRYIKNVESITKLHNHFYTEDDFSLVKVSEWLNYLVSNGYDNSSVKRFKYALNSYFSYLHDNYGLPSMNILIIETPTIEISEINALRDNEIREMAEYSSSLRNKLIILLLYESGMRRQELINCKKKDIDIENLTVNITNSDGDIDRVGYFSRDTANMITDYIEEWKDEVDSINSARKRKGNYNFIEVSEYLFQTIMGYKISYSTIFKAIKDTAYEYYLNKAHSLKLTDEDIKDKVSAIDSELFRHSKRAYLFAQGKTVDQVQAIMGDKNQWATKRYLRVAQQLYPEKFR